MGSGRVSAGGGGSDRATNSKAHRTAPLWGEGEGIVGEQRVALQREAGNEQGGD